MSKAIRILIAEDQAVIRQGLIAIFSFFEDVEVIGQAQNGIDALRLVRELSPDVVVLDLQMPLQGGLDAIPKIIELAPKTGILVLTSFGCAENIYKAIRLGALGFLLKDVKSEVLVRAIHEVSQGKAFIPPHITLRMIREGAQLSTTEGADSLLTQRELETLKLIAKGMSNEMIAKNMVVQERTVSKYVSTILSKLNLENRTQAALYAIKEGLEELS